MAYLLKNSFSHMDTDQAIAILKKGAHLLKYGRRGKPKFCPFRLSNDERILIWYAGKTEKHLILSNVSKLIPGQRTAIFKRYPQPEKEYQSFSLIYNDRSLDVICKDMGEAEVWIGALKALISRSNSSPCSRTQKVSPSTMSCSSNHTAHKGGEDAHRVQHPHETATQNRLGRVFSEVVSLTAAPKPPPRPEPVPMAPSFSLSGGHDGTDSYRVRGHDETDSYRVSLSSTAGSSDQSSLHGDFETLGDVLMWGEGLGNGLLGHCAHDQWGSPMERMDALLPKTLDTTVVLDASCIACGSTHAALITKQGQLFTWGDGSGGKLGHGVEVDFYQPKEVQALSDLNVESVACGDFHSCAVTQSGDLYTWGDGTHSPGLLGHGGEVSHWIPKNISGEMEGLQVTSVSCGPWHTAVITSQGRLFTFGDGTFGALGHGDCVTAIKPREVKSLAGLRTVTVSCGVWHTAAVVDAHRKNKSNSPLIGKLFTWGNGDKNQLGHGDGESKLVPTCVSMPGDTSFCQVTCGHSITVALTVSGHVYTMGSDEYGQLGCPGSAGKFPTCVEGDIRNCFIEEIACGSHHVAVLSSNADVYTWGRGTNGQLGHGDTGDREIPTFVEALQDKQVKHVACDNNFTAVICRQKCVSGADLSICSSCHNPFNFRRVRHNCYNCGNVFCEACSSRRALKAALAPKTNKPFRVCDNCFNKLRRNTVSGPIQQLPIIPSGSSQRCSTETVDGECLSAKSRHQLNRLSSFDSSKQGLKPYCNGDLKAESHKRNALPTQNESPHLESTSGSDLSKKSSVSLPSSRISSRAASPSSWKSGPIFSPSQASPLDNNSASSLVPDNSKQTNGNLSQEMIVLRAQVKTLTRKSNDLEAKLGRKTRLLKEVTKTLNLESEKNSAAKYCNYLPN